ncbi:unnamed protein product [Rodentolepis nana]|uniref:Uncharacterized protein n=1 Tax=Rodentolepis nana TaxID=102285 RepID=A0A0R3U0C3_RODNA|nr:unnamed protein product [Rodentolepis nana]
MMGPQSAQLPRFCVYLGYLSDNRCHGNSKHWDILKWLKVSYNLPIAAITVGQTELVNLKTERYRHVSNECNPLSGIGNLDNATGVNSVREPSQHQNCISSRCAAVVKTILTTLGW